MNFQPWHSSRFCRFIHDQSGNLRSQYLQGTVQNSLRELAGLWKKLWKKKSLILLDLVLPEFPYLFFATFSIFNFKAGFRWMICSIFRYEKNWTPVNTIWTTQIRHNKIEGENQKQCNVHLPVHLFQMTHPPGKFWVKHLSWLIIPRNLWLHYRKVGFTNSTDPQNTWRSQLRRNLGCHVAPSASNAPRRAVVQLLRWATGLATGSLCNLGVFVHGAWNVWMLNRLIMDHHHHHHHHGLSSSSSSSSYRYMNHALIIKCLVMIRIDQPTDLCYTTMYRASFHFASTNTFFHHTSSTSVQFEAWFWRLGRSRAFFCGSPIAAEWITSLVKWDSCEVFLASRVNNWKLFHMFHAVMLFLCQKGKFTNCCQSLVVHEY